MSRAFTVRTLLGAVVAAVAMFAIGFVAWATPAKRLGFSTLDQRQLGPVQKLLAATLPHTGRYIVPDADDAIGALAYRQGPIATIDFNRGGFPAVDPAALATGFVHYLIVAWSLAVTLNSVSNHVPTLSARLRIALGFTTAVAILLMFSDPIYDHHDWRFASYAFVVYLAMLWSASFVLLRWFGVPAPSGQG